MNLVTAQVQAGGAQLALPQGATLPLQQPLPATVTTGEVVVGVRASALRLQERPGDIHLHGQVYLVEISGSDTFVHVQLPWGGWVAQLTGVHKLAANEQVSLYLAPTDCYVFETERAGNQGGALLQLPQQQQQPPRSSSSQWPGAAQEV
ncbi:glycerol-3-phosphate transporter ATP-binding subunit [compost metagenome]